MSRTSLAPFALIANRLGRHRLWGASSARPCSLAAHRRAITRGVRFLVSRQDADGLWRSEVYGSFKDPSALTPLVSSALDAAKSAAGVDQRAVNYLAGMVRLDGTIDVGSHGLPYPVYTAALTVNLLNEPRRAAHAKACAAWAADLARPQLDEKLGWRRMTSNTAGWAMPRSCLANRRRVAGASRTESNLSATTFALEALRRSAQGMTFFAKLGCYRSLPELFRGSPSSRIALQRRRLLLHRQRSRSQQGGDRWQGCDRPRPVCFLRQRYGRWDPRAPGLRRVGRRSAIASGAALAGEVFPRR